MEDWQRELSKSITNAAQLAAQAGMPADAVTQVAKEYPVRITPHYARLIEEVGDPIWKQVVPDPAELEDEDGVDDPLEEDSHSPAPNLTHRYPDRVLLLVTHQCAIYCRFCTRKRKVGRLPYISDAQLEQAFAYIRQHPEIRDIVLSGGDPLVLPDARLEWICASLRAIPHVEILRIGTRVPLVLPSRVTAGLCAVLRNYHPLYINVHFNHPREITPEAAEACGRLADAGIPLGNQAVLLKGVNDDPEVMKQLVHKLLAIRVRPYYLYQADLTKGTRHFRTSIEKGLEIIRALQGFTSGLAVPTFVVDAPGGGGKIPVFPNRVVEVTDEVLVLQNYEGRIFRYPHSVPDDLPVLVDV